MQPTRRSYSKSFKAQVIQECVQPGASIASIALSHNLNANLVHKWIRLQSQKSTALQPAFIPLPVPLAGASLHPAFATEPMDMRAGTETALAKVIAVFGAAQPHCAYLFAKRATAIMGLIQFARVNGHNPYAYLKDVLARLPTQQASETDQLLSHR
jgi:transposase-like protein